MLLTCAACAVGGTLPLLWPGMPHGGHVSSVRPLPAMPVGTTLRDGDGAALFRVTGRMLLPAGVHAFYFPLLTALRDVEPGRRIEARPFRQGRALAWITLSDKGFAGEREDSSGPAIGALAAQVLPLCHEQGFLLPDEAPELRALLAELALGQGYDVVCTTGGTGVSPRDVSPEAALAVLDRRLPGFEQAMMAAGLAKTPHGAISRAVAGIIGRCICITLPGSRRAVEENFAAVLPALAHALDKLHGEPADCGK